MLMFCAEEQQLSQRLKLFLVLTPVQYIHIACHRLNYGVWGMDLLRIDGTVNNIFFFPRSIYLAAGALLHQ